MAEPIKPATPGRAPAGAAADLIVGLAMAALTLVIWAGWLVALRAAVGGGGAQARLTPTEIAFVRAAAPALLLAPIWLAPLWRARRQGPSRWAAALRDSLAPPGVSARWLGLCALWSAPFVLSISTGLTIGGVALAGAMVPAAMPLWAAMLALVMLGKRPVGRTRPGLALIAAAMLLVLVPALLSQGAQTLAAAPWFVSASICFAAFAVAFPQTRLRAAHAVGLVGVYSMLALLAADLTARLSGAPLLTFSGLSAGQLLFEIAWHGVLSGVVSVVSFAIAIDKLGPPAAAISALVPGLAAVIAWAALGETPSLLEVGALALASYGVWLTQRT